MDEVNHEPGPREGKSTPSPTADIVPSVNGTEQSHDLITDVSESSYHDKDTIGKNDTSEIIGRTQEPSDTDASNLEAGIGEADKDEVSNYKAEKDGADKNETEKSEGNVAGEEEAESPPSTTARKVRL